MMVKAFQKSGQTYKTILHQGPHITPTMPNKNYGILIDGKFYDDIVNEWISHYLYGVENHAEEMPEVLVQMNYDQKKWEASDSWDTDHTMKMECTGKGVTVIDTDWERAGISADNFDDVTAQTSTNMTQRFVTAPFEESVTIQGTVCLNIKAALKDGDATVDFHPENRNDADTLTMQLGVSKVSGKMDDIEIAVLLCDVCDEEFDSIQTVDPERNVIPVVTVKEGGIVNGGDLPAFNEAEFATVHKNIVLLHVRLRCHNPEAGYEPETALNSIELKKGEYHDYHIYLNATRYTVQPGHSLAIVIATEDPVNCLIHKTYSVEIENNSVCAVVPVTKATKDCTLKSQINKRNSFLHEKYSLQRLEERSFPSMEAVFLQNINIKILSGYLCVLCRQTNAKFERRDRSSLHGRSVHKRFQEEERQDVQYPPENSGQSQSCRFFGYGEKRARKAGLSSR